MLPPLDEIIENFEFLEDSDRLEYLIELGRKLDPMPDEARTDDKLVPGCESRVWLDLRFETRDGEPVLRMQGDSDGMISKGSVAILTALYQDMSARQAVAADPFAIFSRFNFSNLLTSKRSNGVRSIIERVRRDARAAAGS